jgi:dipeptidyl aminopeptidase/acylaminoacyl peptidase
LTLARKLLCALPAAVILSAVAGAIFTQNTLHVQRRVRPAGGETVEILAKDGATIKASFFEIGFPKSDRCVMALHGISDSRASMAGWSPMFLDAGYAVLAPDSRGHGESGGDLVTYGLLEKDDVILWARWLKTRGCAKVFGFGESLGGSVLLQAAAVRPEWTAIVAESAYADLQDAAEQRMYLMTHLHPAAWLAVTNGRLYARLLHGMDLADASPIRTFASVKTPVLLIHGLDDEQTPPEHSRRLAAVNPRAELWLVPGVRHESAYNRDPMEFRRRVLGWFGAR